MHPNAEIGYLTTMCDTLFSTILDVSGGGTGSSSKSGDDITKNILLDF